MSDTDSIMKNDAPVTTNLVHLFSADGPAMTVCGLEFGWVSTSLLDVDCLACEAASMPGDPREL